MKHYISVLLTTIFVFPVLANRHRENDEILLKLGIDKGLSFDQYDTLLNYTGYPVRLTKNDDEIEHLGLSLFTDSIKESIDKEMLDFVETALLAKILGVEVDGNSDFLFFGGDIADLKDISSKTPCKVTNLNSRFLSFEWNLKTDNALRMDVPIGYNNAKGGNRGEIEKEFIKKIKSSDLKRAPDLAVNLNSLKSYGKGLYVLPGQHYLKEEINRNVYFAKDSVLVPLMTPTYPIESISNLFIYPSFEKKLINVEVTVLKHEYGEKETFITPLENLLAVCEADGCLPYWGIEKFNEGHLTGSLFLYNWKQGYNHVFKIECVPDEILNGKGNIRARASLFIPTNNIQSLFDPVQ